MGGFLRTLAALFTGAVAALLWVEQRQPQRAPAQTSEDAVRTPADSAVERAEAPVADPAQAERITALEAALAAERSRREAAPDEPPPTVDMIRAARARSFALERELALRDDGPIVAHWTVNAPAAAHEIADAAAEHLPEVAWHIGDAALDAAALDVATLWSTLGAMQEFAMANGSDWFEHEGDFAGWCRESGHPHALDGSVLGEDEALQTFTVPAAVNRSMRMVVRHFVLIGEQRVYYVDDLGGETGRMHVVGVG